MIEVRPTALQTYHERYRLVYYHLANLIHNLDADFQSPANYGHDSYTCRKKQKVRDQLVQNIQWKPTDGVPMDGHDRLQYLPWQRGQWRVFKLSSSTSPRRETLRIRGFVDQGNFYGLDILSVTNRSVSEHWSKHESTNLTSGLALYCLRHHQTPERKKAVSLTPVLRRREGYRWI